MKYEQKVTLIAHFCGFQRANFFDLSPLNYSDKVSHWEDVQWFAHVVIPPRMMREARAEYNRMVDSQVDSTTFKKMISDAQDQAIAAYKQARGDT
jgi:hypothetical protein